jgi:phosphatidylserine synthase
MQNLSNFNNMENQPDNHLYVGFSSTLISIFSATYCMVASDIQPIATLIGSIVAILSGIFAIRYYYYATKKIK